MEHIEATPCFTTTKTKDMKELAIIKQENIAQIVQAAPQSYNDNEASHDKCVEAGNKILALIEQNGGTLNEELDDMASKFIVKARNTVRKMNERRSPVTKLFDEVRTAFTSMENDIDPTKTNSISYKLQQLRNGYAAMKREAEEKRLKEEQARQQAKQERERYAIDVEDDLRRQLDCELTKNLNILNDTDKTINLVNFEKSEEHIRQYPTQLSEEWLSSVRSMVRIPTTMSSEDARTIESEIFNSMKNTFCEKYDREMSEVKAYILDRLPSKRANLEKIAKSDEEEAARLKAEMEKRELQESQRIEQERSKREAEERQAQEAKKKAAEMGNLFAEQSVLSASQSKAKVTKKIKLLNVEGILPIITMWWGKEGCTMTTEEIAKMFKKQITFCEKLANKEDTIIQDESIEYVEEVKAR